MIVLVETTRRLAIVRLGPYGAWSRRRFTAGSSSVVFRSGFVRTSATAPPVMARIAERTAS